MENQQDPKVNLFIKSEIEGLIRVVRIFGWLAVIIGIMGAIALATTFGNMHGLVNTIAILSGGILYLIIAEGLSKKKKWAWYLGVISFACSGILNILAGSIINISSGIIALIFLALLLKGKKSFFEQHNS